MKHRGVYELTYAHVDGVTMQVLIETCIKYARVIRLELAGDVNHYVFLYARIE